MGASAALGRRKKPRRLMRWRELRLRRRGQAAPGVERRLAGTEATRRVWR